MKLPLRLAALLLIFLTTTHCASKAQAPMRSTPRVGLALSGGAALGLAHIGVIRYFEQHHIPIDDIAGTSMGGLVGGFYSTGLDSTQMTEIAAQADWNTLLSPSPRFIDQPIADKQKWHRTFGNLTMRFGRGFSLPVGLNPGEALALMLSRTTVAYSDVDDFSLLPTPFRCVATDLITGRPVVLKQGSLAQAMRATMSLPAVFTPVKINGMVLVDGGLVENIPVDVARQMGAQKVIAVELRAQDVKPDQLKSLADILRQSVTVAVEQNERRALAAADLVITVDTTNFSGTDYDRWKEIIQAGYDAAQKKSAELSKYSLTDDEWNQFLSARNARRRPARMQGPVLTVTSASPAFEQHATTEIHRKLGTGVVSQQKLEDTLTGMVAATVIPGAYYEWQKQPDNSTNPPASSSPNNRANLDNQANQEGYKINFAQRTAEQLLVRFAFQYGISPGEPSRAALQLSTATIFKNAYKERLLGTLNVGYDPRIQSEFYRPFGGSPYFIAPSLFVERYHVNSYLGSTTISQTRDRFGGSLYGGIGTWRFAQLRLGALGGYDSYSSSLSVDNVKAVEGAFITPELRWIYDSQDSGGLPTYGTKTEGSIGYSIRNNSYPFVQHEFSAFRPAGHTFTLFATSQQASSFGKKLDYYQQFTSGGQKQLNAFRYQEFHANTLFLGGAGLIIHPPAFQRFSIHPGLALWYEAGGFDMGSKGWQTHQSTSSGILFPTPLGVAGFSVSFDENGKARFRLILGSL